MNAEERRRIIAGLRQFRAEAALFEKADMKPVWCSADGITYAKWGDLELSHHKSVVTYLKRKVESLQNEFEKATSLSRSRGGLSEIRENNDNVAPFEAAWRRALIVLEQASIALTKRLLRGETVQDVPEQEQKLSSQNEPLRKVRLRRG